MKELISEIDSVYDRFLLEDVVRTSIKFNKEEIKSIIRYYLDTNNVEKANFVYEYLVDKLDFKDREYVNRYYLSRDEHFDHEDVVDFFQFCSFDVINIPLLIKAMDNISNYLSHNDVKYPYLRKIIYAIGAQPEPYNIEALENLSKETNDDEVRNLALHQIKKRKELGRWEFKKSIESES